MKSQEIHQQSHHIIYNADLIENIEVQHFQSDFHRLNGSLRGEAMGRGTTQFIQFWDINCAMRHYYRGGLIAKLLKDSYKWSGLENTRAWREWELLSQLYQQALPVPQPVAAHVQRRGIMYQADFITRQIDKSTPISAWLRKREFSTQQWNNIGRLVREFHDKGVYHSDLNAHNILIDEAEKLYIIDFDKGELRPPDKSWQTSNIDRLNRSLFKLRTTISPFYFEESDWYQFLNGYQT